MPRSTPIMLSFEILREEHYSFERALKVLNKFILINNFTFRFFSDFFFALCELLTAHLKKEKILLAHLAAETNGQEDALSLFFETTLLDQMIRNEMSAAKESLLKNEMGDFSQHLEEFILSFSRHIFYQEEGIFARESSLSEKTDQKVAKLFDNCHQPPQGKRLWDTFLFLLQEMERMV
ncbi:MAG: hypothetical protein ABIK97_00405 [candidate division WOR-3 bacterium]